MLSLDAAKRIVCDAWLALMQQSEPSFRYAHMRKTALDIVTFARPGRIRSLGGLENFRNGILRPRHLANSFTGLLSDPGARAGNDKISNAAIAIIAVMRIPICAAQLAQHFTKIQIAD